MGTLKNSGFLHRQVRGLLLLLVTIAPLLGAAILGVLGKPLRRWIAHEVGKHAILQGWWNFFFSRRGDGVGHDGADSDLSRGAAPGGQHAQRLCPGAMLATLLWWVVDVVFGVYVRRVPYGVVYGGLAGGDRLDHLDAAFRGDYFPGRRLERGAGG